MHKELKADHENYSNSQLYSALSGFLGRLLLQLTGLMVLEPAGGGGGDLVQAAAAEAHGGPAVLGCLLLSIASAL